MLIKQVESLFLLDRFLFLFCVSSNLFQHFTGISILPGSCFARCVTNPFSLFAKVIGRSFFGLLFRSVFERGLVSIHVAHGGLCLSLSVFFLVLFRGLDLCLLLVVRLLLSSASIRPLDDRRSKLAEMVSKLACRRLVWPGGRHGRRLLASRSHDVRFFFQASVIVDSNSFSLEISLNPPVFLLGHMPCFMRQMLLLSWPDVNLCSLRVSQRVKARRLGRVVMHTDIVERHFRKTLNTRF